eukprot:2321703-Amphidinium_carterae.1
MPVLQRRCHAASAEQHAAARDVHKGSQSFKLHTPGAECKTDFAKVHNKALTMNQISSATLGVQPTDIPCRMERIPWDLLLSRWWQQSRAVDRCRKHL